MSSLVTTPTPNLSLIRTAASTGASLASPDIALIQQTNVVERVAIEDLLLARTLDDWRDVEALAVLARLHAPRSRVALELALQSGTAQVRLSICRHAPEVVKGRDRMKALVDALDTLDFYGGLTQTLLEVERYHPPEVIHALARGARRRAGVGAHFAAMLLFLLGEAAEPFDWAQRDFFLPCNDNEADRVDSFRELCDRTGVDFERYV